MSKIARLYWQGYRMTFMRYEPDEAVLWAKDASYFLYEYIPHPSRLRHTP